MALKDKISSFENSVSLAIAKAFEKSALSTELIKKFKATRITKMDSCMGVQFFTITGIESYHTFDDLESMWDMTGVGEGEEPTKRLFQKEVDAIKFFDEICSHISNIYHYHGDVIDEIINKALKSK